MKIQGLKTKLSSVLTVKISVLAVGCNLQALAQYFYFVLSLWSMVVHGALLTMHCSPRCLIDSRTVFTSVIVPLFLLP